jgi:hypothetical protein
MYLAKVNDESSFDPTLKLKSSPIPINFISFNEDDYNCIYCGENYSLTYYCEQKYCKKCLSSYLISISDINMYLDVYIFIFTRNLECERSKHEISKETEPQNIQECWDILYFKQIPLIQKKGYMSFASMKKMGSMSVITVNSLYDNIIESKKQCKLCGKSLYQGTNDDDLKLCSDCYLISSGCIESTLTKKPILIIYIPWWYARPNCEACNIYFTFTSDSQKYCEKCLVFYIGCRYCLTTNIIFGITDQSQCKKCKKVSSVIFDITKIFSGNSELDEFLLNLFPAINNLKIDEFVSKIKNIDKYFLPLEMISTICSIHQNYKNTQSEKLEDQSEMLMEWIPFSQFMDINEIARGGFGIIYRATWAQKNVILKKFKNSQDASKYFLNEVETIQIVVLFTLQMI